VLGLVEHVQAALADELGQQTIVDVHLSSPFQPCDSILAE
jgi:hypothetical protein